MPAAFLFLKLFFDAAILLLVPAGIATPVADKNVSASVRVLFRHNRDPCLIRRLHYLLSIQEKALSRIDRQTSCSSMCHGLNCFQADHRHVKAHVLIWLGNFYYGQLPA